MSANNGISTTRRLVMIGLFAALSALLMYIQLPVFFAPPFYQIDLADVPVLIGGFSLGPGAAVAIALVKNLVKLAINPTKTAFIGELSNFMTASVFAAPAAFVYRRMHNKKGATVGLAAGVICMAIFGAFSNAFLLLPTYAKAFGMPMEALIGMGTALNSGIVDLKSFVMLAVVPFNLLKGTVQAVVTMLLYKRITQLLRISSGAQQ